MKQVYQKICMFCAAVLFAVAGSAVLLTPPAAAGAAQAGMKVTLISGGSTYASTVRAGTALILRAEVKNNGALPLKITANLTVPNGWEVDQEKYSDCPESLDVRKTCTISWYFTPQGEGQTTLRVYVRGYYTDSLGTSSRITQSPAFIFNVIPAKGSSSGGSGGSGGGSTQTNSLPNMSVTLVSGNSTYASTVYAGKPLIFQAQVKNLGGTPLQITANLSVPAGWDVDQDSYNDCPESLESRKSCTITWYFTPQAAGQVYLRVHVRGAYTSGSGANRITQSPAFIFNVKPAKNSD
jgi:hypothetical protein